MTGFARTKIQPPQPRGRVLLPRPRIDAPLRDALATQRLVLVSAPAGYGKSALMARQLQDLSAAGTALAWVAADAGDDLPRLLECLVAALEPYDLPWRSAPEALIASAGDAAGRTRFTVELINALEAAGVNHGVIVIDDLHRIDDADVHRFLDALIERLGPRWTIALLTRHDPPLALPRWRVAGELAEFRQDTLRWTRDELAAWLAAAGADAARLDTLLARTEGWAAGVQLALRSASATATNTAIGSERAFTEFLDAEVIDTLDAELRDFLLQVCVLPELTAARAAAVSGRADAARLLDRVEQLGLFVSALDAPEPTLKLHDLLRAALEQRLQRERPDTLPTLLRRAAAGESDPLRRIPLLLRAGDNGGAAQSLLDATPAWITAGALPTVRTVLAQFDTATRERLPAWHLSQCLLGWATGDFATMDTSARAAQALGEASGDGEVAAMGLGYRAIALNFLSRRGLRELGVENLQARAPAPHVVTGVALAWAAIDEGRFADARQRYAGTLDHLERSREPHLWYQGNLGTVGVHIPGMGPLIQRWVDGALAVSGEQPLTLKAMALVTRGWHRLLVQGDVAGARAALDATQQELRWLGEWGEPTGVNALATVLQLQIEAASGDAAATRAAITLLLQGPSTGQGHRARWIVANFIAGCAAAVGDAQALHDQIAVLEATPVDSALPGLHATVLDLARGHAAWQRGDVQAAIDGWQRCVADEVALVRSRLDMPTRLFLAAACLRAGRPQQAAMPLAGLQARARQGAAGSMLVARSVAPLLARQDWRGLLDEADHAELQHWLRRLDTTAAALPAAPAAPGAARSRADAPGSTLSSREREVLERIAAGDSNKLIARAFDLSPHTVKRHVANILDKLALNSRGQAAAWYHENAG
jgi:LuxR family maltose regulon positive regulatory protein